MRQFSPRQRIIDRMQKLTARMHGYCRPEAVKLRVNRQYSVAGNIESLEHAFSDMVARLDYQSESAKVQSANQRAVFTGIAHDLRSPITALQGTLEALSLQQVSQRTGRDLMLKSALAQSKKVSRLASQLFELAALQMTEEIFFAEAFSLSDLLSDLVQKYQSSTNVTGVTYENKSLQSSMVHADLQLIERAISNLIDNAVQHNAPAKIALHFVIQIPLLPVGYIEVLVQDNGKGLPDEVSRRLDKKSAPADTSTLSSRASVSGLGLTITQRVARLHGGQLTSVVLREKGATLCLRIKQHSVNTGYKF